jgi:hypothetical protein
MAASTGLEPATSGLTGRNAVPRRDRLAVKDPELPYAGGRTLKWLKVKQPRYREAARGWDPRNKS